ncbi:MAG: peptidylprolyl isomerase, partial [Bacteroidales bacterium]|nr:peptidylprolyl isomerase [Bacteroidales bacterium]
MIRKTTLALLAVIVSCVAASAQKYNYIDKSVAVIGNEVVLISDIESAVKDRAAQGLSSDRNVRCEVLESILENKLFLMQARI